MSFYTGPFRTTDADLEAFRSFFPRAPLTLNQAQAQALDDLMWGKLRGTTYPDIEPPTSVALFAVGQREGMAGVTKHNRDGTLAPDPRDPRLAAMEDQPPTHTIVAVAEDGRAWSLVRAGICWPIPLPEFDEPS